MRFLAALLLIFLPSLSFANTTISQLPTISGGVVLGTSVMALDQNSTGTLTTYQAPISGLLGPINGTPLGTAAYQVAQCSGGGDESAFLSAAAAAVSANLGSILYRNSCLLTGQWQMTRGGSAKVFGFGNYSSEFNTTQGGFAGPGNPVMRANTSSILSSNAPGEVAIDTNKASQTIFTGVNFFAQTGNQSQPTALIANSNPDPGQSAGCCDQNTLDIISSSMGGGVDTVIGCPMDANLNCLASGGVKSGTLTSGGTGYPPGTYINVPFTGGGGSSAIAQSVIVGSGGAITAVNICCSGVSFVGSGYHANDVVSASNSNLGGSGSGFSCRVILGGDSVNVGNCALTVASQGSGYGNGTYLEVPLTGGAGTGLKAAKIVVAGGIVTEVDLGTPSLPLPGSGYAVGNTLSASNTTLGGSGSGLQYTVSGIYSGGFGAGSGFLPYIIDSNFSGITGTSLAVNFSDARITSNTFTSGQAVQTLFGGGDNQYFNNRFEDNNNSIDIGGPNGNGFIGGDQIEGNQWTSPSPPFGFGAGFDLRIGRGGFNNVIGNSFDFSSIYSPLTASVIIGGNGNISLVNVNDNAWNMSSTSRIYCIDLPSGFTTDYINMVGNVCNGAGIISNVHYGTVPAHFVEDDEGPFGQHAEMNRPFGIGTQAPHAVAQMALDLSYNTTSLGVPVGATATRPASPVEGMLRDNTTNKSVEAYVNGSWTSFSSFTSTNLASYLQGYKNGLTLSNDPTTPNSILDIASGVRQADDNSTTMILGSAFTKTTGTWVSGTGNGALDTGTVANSTWYHVFLIERLDTGLVDILFSASSWMPVMPAGYGSKGWIGAFKTDSSAHILAFTQDGNTFYEASNLDANAVSIGTSSALQTLASVPTGVKVSPLIRPTKSFDTVCVLITSPDQPDEVPTCTYPTTSGAGATLIGLGTTAQGVAPSIGPTGLKTNSSGQIRVRGSATGSTLSIDTYGWIADFGAQISGQITLTSASTSPLVLPNNWNVSANAIDAIGEGGNGEQASNAGGGGAGGCFSRLTNLSDAAGTSEAYQIGAGGTATTTQFKNGSTLVAGFGPSATSQTGATGCATSTSTGSLKHAGGSGGSISGGVPGGGGGGGAGGLVGAGAAGAIDSGSCFGAGGGAGDGGSAGSSQVGGNNSGGFGGGASGGNAGFAGGGGGGGACSPPIVNGGTGGTGTEYSQFFGSGGGGGGGNASSFNGCGIGGNGGGYGAGGGGGGTFFGSGSGCAAGAGAGGLIVLRWLLP